MFDWVGTADPTPFLSVPTAIDVVGGMVSGGWPAIRDRNHRLVLQMRDRLIDAFDIVATGSAELTGMMVSFVLPERWWVSSDPGQAARGFLRRLNDEFGVVVGVATRRGSDDVLFRVSAHLHTDEDTVERLVSALEDF